MIAGVYNITCDQGATFQRVFTLLESDGETPVNLSGYTARMQVRREVDEATSLVDLTTANGRIALGGAAGTITLNLTPTVTAALTDDGVYDLEIVSGAGAVYRVLRGAFRLEREVTRISGV